MDLFPLAAHGSLRMFVEQKLQLRKSKDPTFTVRKYTPGTVQDKTAEVHVTSCNTGSREIFQWSLLVELDSARFAAAVLTQDSQEESNAHQIGLAVIPS